MNDWVQWFGGVTPSLANNTLVEVRFRDTKLGTSKGIVSWWQYGHGQNNWLNDDDPEDIIAYRVIYPWENQET